MKGGEQALSRSRAPPGLCRHGLSPSGWEQGWGGCLGPAPLPQLLHTLSPGDPAPPPTRLIFPTFPKLKVSFPVEILFKHICRQAFFFSQKELCIYFSIY